MRYQWKRNEARPRGMGTQYGLIDEDGATLATVNNTGDHWEAHASGVVGLFETSIDAKEWAAQILGIGTGEITGWYV